MGNVVESGDTQLAQLQYSQSVIYALTDRLLTEPLHTLNQQGNNGPARCGFGHAARCTLRLQTATLHAVCLTHCNW